MSEQFAPTPEEASYWEQIEQYFAAKRGSALILSPKDWPFVHQWEERHIPLEVVYAGIDQAFERVAEQQTPTQHHTIRNLAYCKYDVEAAWKDWQERNPPPVPPDDAAERLIGERRKLQIKLRSTVSQLEKCAATPHYHCISDELTHIASALDGFWPVLEQADDEQILSEFKQRLAALGQELLARLELTLDADTRQRLCAQAEARLVSHKANMTAAVYQETLRVAFLQELHAAYPLPSFL